MSKGYSGIEGNVLSGSTDLDVMNWSADLETATWDSTTTADAGWESQSPATSKISGTFDFLYNKDKPALAPTDATPTAGLGIRQGAQIAALKLYVNKTDGVMLTGAALITKVSLKSETKAGFILTASFINQGPWTLPGDDSGD